MTFKTLLCSVIFIMVCSCSRDKSPLTSLEDDFFPLQVGLQWKYELVYEEFDGTIYNPPEEVITSVIGTRKISDNK